MTDWDKVAENIRRARARSADPRTPAKERRNLEAQRHALERMLERRDETATR